MRLSIVMKTRRKNGRGMTAAPFPATAREQGSNR